MKKEKKVVYHDPLCFKREYYYVDSYYNSQDSFTLVWVPDQFRWHLSKFEHNSVGVNFLGMVLKELERLNGQVKVRGKR